MTAAGAGGALRFVLGDQLSMNLASLRDINPQTDMVLMAEVADECTYVRHHPKKITFVLSAMRHFAETLRKKGTRVDYRTLAETENSGSLRGELARAVQRHRPARVVVTEPGEWRVREDILAWERDLGVPVEIRDDDRFLASRGFFASWAAGRKSLRMEYFYREMRRKTGLLLDDSGEPLGGTWNLDAENRKRLPDDLRPPEPVRCHPDPITREVMELVRSRFDSHFGDLDPFWFAVTRSDAEKAFGHFVATALPFFGDYQDAMKQGEKTLYHAVISLYLNVGLLDPLAVCRHVDREYRKGRVALNAAEGFIRQIIGWREYMRGIYWLKMPDYAETNYFGARRALPDFYWTGETDMNCLRQCITQTREDAYAHHIQRLMVTGNFALLAGIAPKAVCEWYLSVYADAFEWVELPNTHGMALFADGGILSSKPYAASGKYIARMSDYCRHCRYNVGTAEEPGACPFNVLYWNFLDANRDKLATNPRLAMIYRTLNNMPPARLDAIRKQARQLLDDFGPASRS
jgi:deoxyribodipyrimidine photolyase-related protein